MDTTTTLSSSLATSTSTSMPEPVPGPFVGQTGANSALATSYSAAFARRAEAIARVPVDEVLPVNVDVATALTKVSAAMPKIKAQRAAIVAAMPSFDIAYLDDLEDDLLALAEAHFAWLTASTPVASLPALYADAIRLRDTLLVHASSLARAGLIDQASIDEVRSAQGYRGVAVELHGLAALFRARWGRFEGNTPLRLSDLADAQELADGILRTLTAQQAAPQLVAAAAITRQQAFTLFVQAYDEVRAALSFLRRRERDVESIAPSVYAGRQSRKGASDASTDATSPTDPASPASPATSPTDPARVQSLGTDDTIPGMPNAEPFIAGTTA